MQLLSFSADLPLKTSFFEGLIFSTFFMDFFYVKETILQIFEFAKKVKIKLYNLFCV